MSPPGVPFGPEKGGNCGRACNAIGKAQGSQERQMCPQEKLCQSCGCAARRSMEAGPGPLGRSGQQFLMGAAWAREVQPSGLLTPSPTSHACAVGARWKLRATGRQDSLPSASGARPPRSPRVPRHLQNLAGTESLGDPATGRGPRRCHPQSHTRAWGRRRAPPYTLGLRAAP